MWHLHCCLTEMEHTVNTELLWSQEFDGDSGSAIDETIWNFDIGDGSAYQIPGWGNQEREYYVKEAANVDGQSNLEIHARRMYVSDENHHYSAAETSQYMTYYNTPAEWLSSKLTTYKKVAFQYGRIEARIRVPKGAGTWPAFWMLGTDIQLTTWPSCGEIDILETKGDLPTTIFGTVHGPGYCAEAGKGAVLDTHISLADDFHIFAIEWLENQITWFMDGNQFLQMKASDISPLEWVYNKPFYLIVNLAIGGNFAGAIDPVLTEAKLQIDYIRHYSLNGVGQVFCDDELTW